MPRAHRCFLPNHIWHITHRCHNQEYLLKFAKDRQRWLRWLTEARKRYGLCVLNYIVTSNHIHLLVYDSGENEIARSMQLVASRTAQEYNRRKQRKGAFWEDRYHATAVDSDDYLARCMVYIDLNMVRAGVVSHPAQWPASGYREIQQPPKHYRIIDLQALMTLLGISQLAELQRAHAGWADEALLRGGLVRHGIWTESLAVGSQAFVARMKEDLGMGARYRKLQLGANAHYLQEPVVVYNIHSQVEKSILSTQK